jgi:mRNA interferase HigB
VVGEFKWNIPQTAVDNSFGWRHFVVVRIIAEGTIRQWAENHARAASSLRQWVKVVRVARWKSFAALRRTFPSADFVTVRSGRKVVVFNIGGNDFRLLCGVHFNTGMVFALRFLTHAEYSTNNWKDAL